MNGTVIQFARIECLVLVATTKLVSCEVSPPPSPPTHPSNLPLSVRRRPAAQLPSFVLLEVRLERITRRSRISSASNELVISSIF